MSNELGNGPWDKNYQPSGISKEEELADEYQRNHEQLYHVDSYPIAIVKELERNAYICGMKQAEKDLDWEVNHREEAYTKGFSDGLKERLTWEDAQLLHIITEKYMRELDNRIEAYPSSSQELFEEVLRRFYEKKK